MARRGSFASGIVLLFVAIASPVDSYGEESSQALHMTQHILIGDLAPLAIVAGLTGPILRPLLAYIHPLRRLFHPVVALTVWAAFLTFWHIPFFYEFALHNAWAHGLEHICFFVGGTLIWVPLLETLPMPEWFGTGMKMGFIVVVRVYESILGNVLRFGRTVRSIRRTRRRRAPAWNLTAVNDQRIAGSIMMVEGSLLTLLVLAWFFLRLASGRGTAPAPARKRARSTGGAACGPLRPSAGDGTAALKAKTSVHSTASIMSTWSSPRSRGACRSTETCWHRSATTASARSEG